jgi:hypothetical protein
MVLGLTSDPDTLLIKPSKWYSGWQVTPKFCWSSITVFRVKNNQKWSPNGGRVGRVLRYEGVGRRNPKGRKGWQRRKDLYWVGKARK